MANFHPTIQRPGVDGSEGNRGAVSSAVEHYLDTVGVTGSNPVSRTTVSNFLDFNSTGSEELRPVEKNVIKQFECGR
jgi:hypothetical protein